MKVTVLPYKPPRKPRKVVERRFCVRWGDGATVFFRWFFTDRAAVAFLNVLVDHGVPARVTMK